MTDTLQTNYCRPRLHQPSDISLPYTYHLDPRLIITAYAIAVYKHLQICNSQHYHANLTKQFTNNFYLTWNVWNQMQQLFALCWFQEHRYFHSIRTTLPSRVQRQFIDKNKLIFTTQKTDVSILVCFFRLVNAGAQNIYRYLCSLVVYWLLVINPYAWLGEYGD